jgi:hypothetical protein
MQYQQPSSAASKKLLHLFIAALLLAVLAITLLAYTHNAHAASITSAKSKVASTCGSWNVISSPNPGVGNESLYGIAAVSANNVWAVGNTQNNGVGNPQTLIEHWNGTSWSVVSSPNPGSNNILYAVARVPGTKQIWAVGLYYNNNLNQTLIEHWDGATWSVINSPNPSSLFNVLYGVTAISANNVWAVGYSVTSNAGPTPTHALIEHWDGTSWTVVSSPNPGSIYNYLNGVTFISASNVWVVGSYLSSGNLQTLTERWNGKKWSVIPSPNVGTQGSSFINAARVPGTKQIWAIGNPLAYWDGTHWNIVSSLSPGLENELEGITSVSANNVWAVGDYLPNGSNYRQTLIEHWDGASWSVVSSPSVGISYSYLKGAVGVPGTNQVWAVGFYNTGSYTQTLIEFYC